MELVSSPEVLPGNPPDPPVSSQRSLPTPMPVKPVPRHPISDVRGAGGVVKSGKTPSLDNVLAQSSSLDQSGLISLIEVWWCTVPDHLPYSVYPENLLLKYFRSCLVV